MSTPDQLFSSIQAFQQREFGPKGNRRAPGLIGPWMELLQRAAGVVETLAKRESAIMRDTNLSREGRAKALADLGKAAPSDFRFVGEKLTNAQEFKSRCMKACLDYMTRPKGNESVQEDREREVRDSYRAMPQLDRDLAFLKAAEQVNAETMRGLQAGPGGPWISGEALSRAEQLYAERRNPELYAQWQAIEVLIEHIQGIATHAAQVLLTMTMGTERPAILKALGLPEVTTTEEGPAHA